MSRYTGVLGPFRFDSDLALPELRDSDSSPLLPVRIRVGPVPRILPGGVVVDRFCTVAPDEYLLHIPGIARFRAGHGREITVEPEGDAPAADLRIYLLGSIFGALCHQNGYLPLHASAVAFEGAVTAFLGPSGAGKSTLAAALARRGHTVVSDDICLLDPAGSDRTRVIPVAGWMKLWRRTLDYLGETAKEEHRVFSSDDKFRVFLDQPARRTFRLTHLVLLNRPETTSAEGTIELRPLAPSAALGALMDHTYLAYIASATGAQKNLFANCAALLGRVKPYRMVAPLGWDRLEETLDRLEADILGRGPHPG